MALHLNLYHEIHRQEQRERRDPVKLAGLAALLFLVFLVVWFSYRLSVVNGVERKRNQLRISWNSVEPQMKKAVEDEARLLAQQKSNQALVERVHERFYWASFLGKMVAATPSHVQLLTFTGELGAEKEKTVDVLVRGLAAGAQPRTAAEDYRRSLQEKLAVAYSNVSVVFDANSLEDSMESVTLDGQTMGTATFRIRVQFNPKAAK
ncbi:MAG: hypothetical protein NTZ46_03295 [Verrucomicrobia bacterium]|nr:hypothetical protein [Verrucomicrobiota bacterium]